MKEIIPVPEGEDFIKQFEKDERLAEEDAKGENTKSKNTSNEGKQDTEEEPNEFGIILKEKEWFKKSSDQ